MTEAPYPESMLNLEDQERVVKMKEELLELGATDSSMPLHCVGCGMEYENDPHIRLLKALLDSLEPTTLALIHGYLFREELTVWESLDGLSEFLRSNFYPARISARRWYDRRRRR